MPFKMTVSEVLFGRWGIPRLQNFRRLTTNDRTDITDFRPGFYLTLFFLFIGLLYGVLKLV
jgi:hypothetical protein